MQVDLVSVSVANCKAYAADRSPPNISEILGARNRVENRSAVGAVHRHLAQNVAAPALGATYVEARQVRVHMDIMTCQKVDKACRPNVHESEALGRRALIALPVSYDASCGVRSVLVYGQ